MKLKIITVFVGTLVIANAYAQETYNIQAGLQNETSSDNSNNDKTSSIISGTYYFKNIVIHSLSSFLNIIS